MRKPPMTARCIYQTRSAAPLNGTGRAEAVNVKSALRALPGQVSPREAACSLGSSVRRIVDRFVDEVRHEQITASLVDREEIVDNLPSLISNIVDALEHGEGAKNARESSQIGKAHGSFRAAQAEYSLEDLFVEYQILGVVIRDSLTEDEQLDPKCELIISDAIYRGLGNAAAEFMHKRSEKQKDATKEAYGLVAQLEEERGLRERFVSVLTHDLRSPLTAARMNAELIARQNKMIVENMDRMDKMIRNLLDANLLRAGEKLPISPAKTALRAILRDAIERMSRAGGNRIILDGLGETEGFWDADALTRVFENLLSNALKYGDPQTPVTLGYKDEGASVLILVHNEGEPIPFEYQSRLFEPFVRGPWTRDQKGWGLGLTLVRGIVDAHGGSVSVNSGPKVGTTFAVRLPKNRI